MDTINIRLALLQNNKLIEYINDEQIRYNIQYILKIVLRGDAIDENIVSELIIFIVKLFMNDKNRNITFIVLRPLMNDNMRLYDLFKESLKRTSSSKLTLPKRILMFLECIEFYEFDNNVHEYFIIKLCVTNDDDIIKWNKSQIQNIQCLSEKYTQKNNKTGIKIWINI